LDFKCTNMKKTTFKLKTADGLSVLDVRGTLTFTQAPEFKNHLLEWIKKEGELVLRLKDVDMMDTSALQLIYAIKTAFKESNRTLKIEPPSNIDLTQLLTRTGFINLLTSN
jgi:anti-anti-sigma factor